MEALGDDGKGSGFTIVHPISQLGQIVDDDDAMRSGVS